MDLTGHLVRLRAPLPEDAPFIAEYVSMPEVARTLDAWAHAPYSVEHALDWVRRHDPSSVNWAIELLDGGAFIGCTGLRELDFRDRNCEWGIWIGPPTRWNRGYGTEACRLATAYAFRELGMEKVYLKVYETNPGGRRAYEKAGYRVEGTLPRDHWWEGGFTTSYLMAVHRDDPLYEIEEPTKGMNDEVERLLEDLRLLGPTGIERVTEAWRAVAAGEDAIRTAAERRAEDDPEWREAEVQIFSIARGESWLSVPPTERDAAAAAAQDALLGLLERKTLGEGRYRTLVGPMAAALPWLLSGEREDRY